MAAVRPFADMLAQFLTIHLPVTRACSRTHRVAPTGTRSRLFLRFMDQRQATPPDKVSFADFTAPNVAAFLGWLRTDRQCSDRHRQPTPGRVEIVLPLRPGPSPRAGRTSPAGPRRQSRPSPRTGHRLPARGSRRIAAGARHTVADCATWRC